MKLKYLETGTCQNEEINMLFASVQSPMKSQPIFAQQPLKQGVQRMLDAVLSSCPSPIRLSPVKARAKMMVLRLLAKADDSEKFSAIGFKYTDPYVGQLTFYAF